MVYKKAKKVFIKLPYHVDPVKDDALSQLPNVTPVGGDAL